MTQVTQEATRAKRKTQAAPPIPSAAAPTPKPAAESEVAAQSPGPVPPIPQSAMQDAAFARNWWRVVIDGERTPYHSVLILLCHKFHLWLLRTRRMQCGHR